MIDKSSPATNLTYYIGMYVVAKNDKNEIVCSFPISDIVLSDIVNFVSKTDRQIAEMKNPPPPPEDPEAA